MRATDALESLRRRRGAWARRRAAVLHVDLDRGLEPLTVPQGYPSALLIVHQQGAVLGQVLLPARGVIPVEEQWSAIAHRMGAAIWRQRLRRSLAELAAASGPPVPAADPPVAVVVCTRDRTDQLRACLDSLLALRTPAAEILVVDNAPSDDRTRRLCDGYPVRYVLEPLPGQTRARNRGIVETGAAVVAFTDDDCVVDAGWLDGLGEAFRDPLVMAVTGYTGPLELEHHAQYLFELHGGFDRHPEPVLFDPLKTDPIIGAATAGAGANMMFRREVFRAVGLFAEDLGPGTPARAGDDKDAFYRVLAAGYRIGYDPARIVWHRHRGDWDALRRALEDYGVAEFAFTARALATRRDAGVVQIWRWWARHLVGETRRALTGRPGRMPLALPASEARGWLGGPAGTIRSARSRRGIPPIELPPERPPTAAPAPAPAPALSIAVVGEPPPALSVAIASRERAVMLRRILTALAAQDHPADRFEVVVVLDGSTDDSASLARGHEVPFAV
ncbi:MAG TPA: glycosyltransferase, partial [Solirubrobacteraceae bacterium]|nr:glycosyltransferase [Solirubrobacteraceae bacterium]